MLLMEIDALLLSDLDDNKVSYQTRMENRVKSKKIAELADPTEDQVNAIIVSQTEIETEFLLFKDELRAIENERLRIEDLKNRISLLNDDNSAHHKLNPNFPNKNLWRNQNIINNPNKTEAENNMKALEIIDGEIKTERESIIWIENRKTEYKKIDIMLLEAIAEKEAGNPSKMNEYLALRAKIKIDNPKPSI